MPGIRFAIVVAAAIGAVFVAPAAADIVELKNGQRVDGVLKQADQSTVMIEVGGQTITFRAEQVRAIYYGSAAAPPAAGTPLSDALRGLKDLQSVVKGGVSFRDYGPRVANANIAVDRFLETPASGDEEARSALREAISFYQVAGTLWSMQAQGERVISVEAFGRKLPGGAALSDKCPGTQLPGKGFITLSADALNRKELWVDPVSALWSCASERIVVAAKTIEPGR